MHFIAWLAGHGARWGSQLLTGPRLVLMAAVLGGKRCPGPVAARLRRSTAAAPMAATRTHMAIIIIYFATCRAMCARGGEGGIWPN